MDGNTDVAAGFGLNRNGEHQRKCFQVADGLTDVLRPKGDDGNAAANSPRIVLGLDGSAEGILLGKLRGHGEDFVFAPFQARTLKRPHLMRGCRRVGESSVEAVLLQEDGIKPHAGLTRIAERSGHEREAGKVVVKIERKGLFQPTAGTARANFNVLPRFAQLSLRVTHLGIGSIKRKIAHALACNGDYLPGPRAGIIQSGNRILTGKAGLQIAIGEKQELRCGRLHAQPVGSGDHANGGGRRLRNWSLAFPASREDNKHGNPEIALGGRKPQSVRQCVAQ